MRIELEGINKSFGSNHVLKDLGFSAKSGKAFGLLGRNGSGKTTTIRIIMGIFPQDSGRVSINGGNYKDNRNTIGYLPEERGLYPKRVIIDQMVYFGELRGMKSGAAKKRAEMLLEKLEATEYLNRKLDTLSKGNQQKIQLAISLITDPDILILDEPFSGLDPVNAGLLKSLVQDMVTAGKLVIFCSHQMASVEELCDDICIIEKGRIVLSGELAKIKKTYPRNRILIAPESTDFADVQRRLQASPDIRDISTGIEIAKKGCVITLKNELDKLRLFTAVNGMNVSIDTFQVMEPTLEEIFIEKAGGGNEPV
ncbi:MAG: ATP-binding cassette domain-containing protein [Defluviitaleaceae bacterium]|nr:ATP-binding cassette domain-containing protein [Defluviitaleaceae bacterium]MCL2836481.1 ATP-binding cassette domain-containing protein [Defluviitaleaceae bacterium]